MHLRELKESIDGAMGGSLDAYTKAHLQEASVRIEKALDADYIYNAEDMSGGGGMTIIFGQEGKDRP